MQTRTAPDIYAEPRLVPSASDCYFYHTQEIPGLGLVQGEWDLRPGIDAYLGKMDFRGKRVLELGTADGFITFHIERHGGEVVSYDLSDDYDWDVVPFARSAADGYMERFMAGVGQVNNSYWFCHHANRSQARMVYGDVYHIPQAIGPVDISVYGAILCHLHDPFEALRQGLRLTRETVVITDGFRRFSRFRPLERFIPPALRSPSLKFLPNATTGEPKVAWWEIGPEVIKRFIGVLGFEDAKVTYHAQRYLGRTKYLFTVVGHRTAGR